MGTQAQPQPQTSQNFGRAWAISIETADGNNYVVRSLVGKGEEPLRATFQVSMYMMMAYWFADVSIYNLSNSTAAQLTKNAPNVENFWKFNQKILSGDTVTISAGYQEI